MPLNISKLEEMLLDKGFVVTKYYVSDGLCFYLEVVSTVIADAFLLYIPTKYKFEPPAKQNVYKIKYIATNYESNIEEEYVNSAQIEDVDEIKLAPDAKDKLETYLEGNYKKDISIKDISKEDALDLKVIYKQVKRLGYSVKSIPYKLGITYKNYICGIRRDDSIDCFSVKNIPRKNAFRILVIVDLETFYEKSEKVNENLATVKTSVCEILNKNHSINAGIMKQLTDNTNMISTVVSKVVATKERFDTQLKKLTDILSALVAKEADLGERLHFANKHTAHVDSSTDLRDSGNRIALESELRSITDLKDDVIRTLLKLREEQESNVLSTDKVMFDNTVLFDHMLKNFSKLG